MSTDAVSARMMKTQACDIRVCRQAKMMKSPSVTIIVSVLITMTPEGMYGQDARRRATGQGDVDPACRSATVIIDTRGPSGLIDAIRRSSVILDGTVSSVLPSVSVGLSLETDAVINISTVLKGTIPANTNTALLVQMGGHLGDCKVTIHHDKLVVPGERYILFLIADTRTSVPNTSGLPRYRAIGLWAGKVRVDGDVIHISPDVNSGWKALDGQGVNAFIEMLKATIRQPYGERDKQAPTNFAPPK